MEHLKFSGDAWEAHSSIQQFWNANKMKEII